MLTARKFAFKACLKWWKQGEYLQHTFETTSLDNQNLKFAQELAYGVVRHKTLLDYQLSCRVKRRHFKVPERLWLYLALYQLFFMNSVPNYAAVHESIEAAKSDCHPTFIRFFNAFLRKISKESLIIPEKNTLLHLSIRYSQTLFFTQSIFNHYNTKQQHSILEALNRPPTKRFARLRKINHLELPILFKNKLSVVDLENIDLQLVADSPNYYIQNITPSKLIDQLAQTLPCQTHSILDLCASPGGKAWAIADLFPSANLHLNDINEHKLKRLKQNAEKLGIPATFYCHLAQEFPTDVQFDLVIVDLPCSNTGLFHRKPEARWRLDKDSLTELNKLQKEILSKAIQLIKPKGQLWMMTCSILPQENEELSQWLCSEFSLKPLASSLTILPNNKGWDGGFAMSFTR